MSARTLSELEASIDALDPRDQARLLQHLVPRVAEASPVRPNAPVAGTVDAAAAVRRYRAAGERLAATSVAGAVPLTDAVSRQRR